MANASPMFSPSDSFKLLACDADSIIYRVAATTNSLETAKRRFVQNAMTYQLLAGAELVRLHLTPKHCTKAGRFNVLAHKPYQGNRVNAKGKPPLVEPLRYAVGRKKLDLPSDMEIVFNDVYEADDSVIMDGVQWGDDCVIYSEDKDLLCTRNRMLDPVTSLIIPGVPLSSIGTLELKELSASKKVVGRGPLFFWAQMLMGDTADNIKGITKLRGKLCGPAKTFDLMESFINTSDEAAVARFVLTEYMVTGQNPWPEAWLLWLYPKEGYNFFKHVKALGLLDDSELGQWLLTQLKLNWFNKDANND
ncbi:Phage protein [Yersinia phage phiR8-01]|uniref:Phage protein n=1 Tax=Yersinia phage phiR8-01 TaxID=1206556 RepID=I7KQQ3_9CAUD|nr:exonuclease [Yersinia phage phiR8-01]CCI88415.1 Phage protein [Yersinia phage phiR8-01]